MRPSRETIGERSRTHGMSRSRFYVTYCSIRQRCEYKKHSAYKRYGAKGIKRLWKNFQEFKDDMYESYVDHVKKYGEKETQIDRINPKGNYEKSNCRWVTILEQGRNRSNNVRIIFDGKSQTIKEWAAELGINFNTISIRHSRGWPVENVLSPKIFHRYRSGRNV